jgi:hypothetical protein
VQREYEDAHQAYNDADPKERHRQEIMRRSKIAHDKIVELCEGDKELENFVAKVLYEISSIWTRFRSREGFSCYRCKKQIHKGADFQLGWPAFDELRIDLHLKRVGLAKNDEFFIGGVWLYG